MNSFNRKLELADGFETDYLRLLYYDFPEYYKDSYNSYEYNRLCTILEGEKHVQIDDNQKFTYDNSKYILLPPNSTVNMEIEKPTKALVLEISDQLIDNINKKVSIDLELDMKGEAEKLFLGAKNLGIGPSLNRIIDLFASEEVNKEFLIDLHAQELTYGLLRTKGANIILSGQSDNPMARAIHLMKENVTGDLNISEIAYHLNMSTSSFSNKFKKLTKVTPLEYFTNLKMLKAKEMLVTHSVTEVSFELGYNSPSHFIRVFKLKFGLTPKQYKKSLVE